LKNIDNIYLINGESPSIITNEELYTEGVNKVKKENIGVIGTYSSFNLSLNNIFNEDSNVLGLSVDNNFYNMLNTTLILGDGFNAEDFASTAPDIIPIILGSDYRNRCKLNDIFEDKNSGQKYTVKGFLKPNKYLLYGNYDLSMYLNSKNCFIIPMNTHIGNMQAIIKFNDMKSSNIKFNDLVFENMKDAIKIDVNEFLSSKKKWLPFLIMSLVAALMGIIISTILSILFRRREFGIKIVLGESLNKILFKVTIENTILATIAIICAANFTYIMNAPFIKGTSSTTLETIVFINFNIDFFGPVILVITMITLITSLIVFKIIKRIEPKDLIGGID
jgi:putative ABC transport system permease protein